MWPTTQRWRSVRPAHVVQAGGEKKIRKIRKKKKKDKEKTNISFYLILDIV
jgi:hypothetical protein